MALSPRLSEGATGPRAYALPAGPVGNDHRDAPPRNPDWDLARITNANLLLVGDEQIASNLVFSMWSIFVGPIAVRRPNERLHLPPTAEPIATMVLHCVDTLTGEEQHALYDWLTARNGRTRVVSTATASVMPMVQARAFSSELYYRLNTIWVDLSAC